MLLSALFGASSCSSFIDAEGKQNSGADGIRCVSVHFTANNEFSRNSRAISNYYHTAEDLNGDYFDRIIFTGTLLNAPSEIPAANKSFKFEEDEKDGKSPSRILDDTEFDLCPGKWKLNFEGYKDISKNYAEDILQQMNLSSTTVLLASCEDEIEISEDSSVVQLFLRENDELEGGVALKLIFPTSGYAKITTETVKISDIITPGTETEISADEIQSGQANLKGAFDSGNWLLRLRFYSDDERTILQSVKTAFFGSRPGRVLDAEYDFSKENINSTYKIEYNLNGGNISGTYKKFYNLSENVTLPDETSVRKDGFEFGGWYLSEDFAGEPVSGWAAGDKSGNVVLYAKWNFILPPLPGLDFELPEEANNPVDVTAISVPSDGVTTKIEIATNTGYESYIWILEGKVIKQTGKSENYVEVDVSGSEYKAGLYNILVICTDSDGVQHAGSATVVIRK